MPPAATSSRPARRRAGIGRAQPGDAYDAIGTVKAAGDGEIVLDIGERQVVVRAGRVRCPVAVGATARASGP